MGIDGSGVTTQATRFRNAIALATDPSSGTVWAGGAGQDDLPQGHPYDFLDPVSAHAAPADYGWPDCEEDHVAYTGGANCSNVVVPAIEFPAYSTIIGAAFYPATQSGPYAFPAAWRGGLFVGMHGSWHTAGGVPVDPPHVAYVPFSNGAPARAVMVFGQGTAVSIFLCDGHRTETGELARDVTIRCANRPSGSASCPGRAGRYCP